MGPGERDEVSDLVPALRALLAALDQCGIAYFVGGSVASGIHGIYRTSMDAGLVADIRAGQVAGLARRLGGDFYADAAMMQDTPQRGRSFNVIHLASSFKFNIFPLRSDAYGQTQFARRMIRGVTLGDETLSVPVSSAEDTLLMKLAWHRAGGETSERQWNDIRGIVAIQGDPLDRAYLRQWAGYLKVADLLEEALAA